eukprot:1601413-Prymnesium_polylepis.4
MRLAGCVSGPQVGPTSKTECCALRIVVCDHTYTNESIGCDGASRGGRVRDRAFRHLNTIVDTP